MSNAAERWLSLAQDLLDNGQYKSALEAAAKAQRAGAPLFECLRIQAQALVALGRHGDAQRVLAQLVAHDPEDVWALQQLAELHARAGRLHKAVALLQQAMIRSPNDHSLQTRLQEISAAIEASRLPQSESRRPAIFVLIAVALICLAAGGGITWFLFSSAQRLHPQSKPAAALPSAQPPPVATPSAGSVAKAELPASQAPSLAQAKPTTGEANPLTQASPPQGQTKPLTQAEPVQRQAKPLHETTPKSKPKLKILWLRCYPVPSMTVRAEGKVRRVYVIYGEVLNDSDVPCEVAVIRGRLLAHGQAAGYGLAELGQIPPHGRARFSFYAYQLADEHAPPPDNYDAIAIPGFGLSKMLESLGLGPDLEQIIRSGEVPEP